MSLQFLRAYEAIELIQFEAIINQISAPNDVLNVLANIIQYTRQ